MTKWVQDPIPELEEALSVTHVASSEKPEPDFGDDYDE